MRQNLCTLLALLGIFCTTCAFCDGYASGRTVLQTPKIAAPTEPVPPERFRYMCSIRATRNRSLHLCGGILIHPLWVLTAAHCLDPNNRDSAGALPIVYCGIYHVDENDDEDIFSAVDSKTNEGWNGDVGNGYDIALLKLNREANLPVPRLATPAARPVSGSDLGAVGWGETTTEKRPETLQYSSVITLVSHTTCNEQWNGIVKDDLMICAGIGRDDTCRGDSGGPLLQADTPRGDLASGKAEFDLVYGISSFGEDTCGGSTKAGVYTFVGYFREWITSITEGTSSTTPSPSPTQRCNGLKTDVSTAVREAIADDDVATLTTALNNCLDPNSRYNDTSVLSEDYDYTLLHWAAGYDAAKSAQALVDYGADVQGRNIIQNTALHVCGFYGSVSVAEILLAAGANVDASGYEGRTPIHYAALQYKLEILQFLVKNGARVSLADDSGDTPLHRASNIGYFDVVKILLDSGADVAATDSSGHAPLHEAAIEGHADIVEILVKAGADVDAEDDIGETPLHEASEYGHLDIVKILVDAGASTDVMDKNGNIPADIICKRASPECTRSTRSAIEDLIEPFPGFASGPS